MSPFSIPDWQQAYRDLLTTRPFGEETLMLPVAGRRLDYRNDYSRLFARDSLLAAFLFDEREALGHMLRYFAAHQGRRPEAFTAQEPGKIPHEIPGVTLRGYNTLYAACDTTALFLLGCARYAESGSFDGETWDYLTPRIAAASGYLRAHIEDGLFLEDPALSGARNFALRATYWRDYGIPGRRGRRLRYPVAFLLVQAQAIAALRALLRLTEQRLFPGERRRLAGELQAALAAFRRHFDCGDGFVVAHDAVVKQDGGVFRGVPVGLVSTDNAHALWYLEPEDVSDRYRAQVLETLAFLETPYGWKTWLRASSLPGMSRAPEWLWPFEHAFIADGLDRHGFTAEASRGVAMRPARFLGSCDYPFSEYVNFRYGKPIAAGCHVQLWTVAYWAWRERHAVSG